MQAVKLASFPLRKVLRGYMAKAANKSIAGAWGL